MVDIGGVIASLFVMLKEDIYVLIRIQILVGVATVMFLVMFMVDVYRCRSHNSMLATVLKTADGMSDQIVIYLLGAMQSVGFENQLFPVWAVVLVSLRASLGYLSGYGIPDNERRFTEVANVIKFLGVAMLSGRGFSKPLWSLWAILLFRSVYRFYAGERAIKSWWHGRSSEFLPAYMRAIIGNHEEGDDFDNDQIYLVYGESNQRFHLRRPGYVLELNVLDERSLITLNKILECSESLLRLSSNSNIERYKDISLAFALSRILRCRLEDMSLDRESIFVARHLFTSENMGVLHMDAERAFGILELELAFVRDYLYTLYPLVFWSGLGSLCFSLLLSMATFLAALWLATDIRKVYYQPPEDGLMLQVNGENVDAFITWVFMSFMMFKEVWEMVTYLLSNWTRLLLICKYAPSMLSRHLLEKCLKGSFFKSQIAQAWHGYMDQYDLLHSFSHKPLFLKVAHAISLGMVPEKLDGKKSGKAIKVPECVKEAILQALNRIDLNNTQLPREIPSLRGSSVQRFELYSWACLELHTCSQVILVWHIATSLCEIKLAQEFNIDLTNPGFPRSAFSRLKTLCCCCCCCTSEPNLLNKLQGQLKANYHTATSLSRYCAYLQVFVSALLPDSFGVPDLIFADALRIAHGELRGCDCAESRYDKLIAIADDAARDNVDTMNTVQQGATLAKDLIENEDTESRWEIIAGVWADLLVHLAPSWNAADHKYHLESGGEFITLLWVLLSHCGIEKSSLWDKDDAPEGNDQEFGFETSNILPVEEQSDEDGIGSEIKSDIK